MSCIDSKAIIWKNKIRIAKNFEERLCQNREVGHIDKKEALQNSLTQHYSKLAYLPKLFLQDNTTQQDFILVSLHLSQTLPQQHFSSVRLHLSKTSHENASLKQDSL